MMGKEEYYICCRDCGQFVTKYEWILKNNKTGSKPLCVVCASNYDDGPQCRADLPYVTR